MIIKFGSLPSKCVLTLTTICLLYFHSLMDVLIHWAWAHELATCNGSAMADT